MLGLLADRARVAGPELTCPAAGMPEQPRPIRVLHCLWSGETGGAEPAVNQLVREQIRDPAIEPALLFAQRGGPFWGAAPELRCPGVGARIPHRRAFWTTRRAAAAPRGFDVPP